MRLAGGGDGRGVSRRDLCLFRMSPIRLRRRGGGSVGVPPSGGSATFHIRLNVAVEVVGQLWGWHCGNLALREFGNAAPFEAGRMKQFHELLLK